jgi:HPt (histidine-containing phosphotransfer) domain-containing protein
MSGLFTEMKALEWGQLVALVVGGIWALVQWRHALQQRAEELEQRARELKWRQGKLAWKLTDSIHETPDTVAALKLLDHETDTVVADGTTYTVNDADIASALHFTPDHRFLDDSPKARAIRATIDALLYALERLNHAIRLDLMAADDVFAPTKYYSWIISRTGGCLEYAREIGYTGAAQRVELLAKEFRDNGSAPERRAPASTARARR